jgi:hypothetical protein
MGFRMNRRHYDVGLVASAGVAGGYLDTVTLELRDDARSTTPASRALAPGVLVICNDLNHDPDCACGGRRP